VAASKQREIAVVSKSVLSTVATLVEPSVRSRLEAAGHGTFAAIHTDSVGEAIRAVRERPVRAVFVSPSYVGYEDLPRVADLVDGFPGVPTVALLSRYDADSSRKLLDFGAHGVRRMVDLSGRHGWQYLRDLISHPASPTAARIFERVVPALGEATHDCRAVFEAIVRLAPALRTARAIADYLQVAPSTFMSRFFRAGLPSPKRYLAGTRLLYAASLLEIPGFSIADVAYRLQYSSPQSFGRHLRTVFGITASDFRSRYRFETAVDDFVERLIVPFRSRFSTFHPLDRGVGFPGQIW
jgi:AraC-like DNA-binding protein